MSIPAGDLKCGDIIEIEGQKYRVRNTEHVKPGKGGAIMQTVLYNIEKPQKKEMRFRVEEKVEIIQIYDRKGTFLYKEGNEFVFLDPESVEEFRIQHMEHSEFLVDGCDVTLSITANDDLLCAKLPETIVCEVEMTTGYLSGQSAASQDKPATLKNGVIIKVPQYIKDGDKIKINTERLEFVSKA